MCVCVKCHQEYGTMFKSMLCLVGGGCLGDDRENELAVISWLRGCNGIGSLILEYSGVNKSEGYTEVYVCV